MVHQRRELVMQCVGKQRRGNAGRRVNVLPRGRSAPRRRPLAVEALEPRSLLATVVLNPVADNTLYESAAGDVSNGAGHHLFAGQAALRAGIRRGLLKFDVAAAIPAGAQIDSVTLRLNMSRTISGARDVALHRVLADWGEGSSDAPGEEGMGTAATAGDATWQHTFFPSTFWTTDGGDFSATPSAVTSVAFVGTYQWTSSQMAADVQQWLNAPSTQFGWLIKEVIETTEGSAKRFDSKENPTAAFRPQLTVQYTLANQPPTDILLSNASVPENANTASPVPIGNLSAVDPDLGDTHTFQLVSGAGSADNGSFQIVSSQLQLRAGTVLDFETKPQFQIRVSATDQGGQSFEKALVISVIDINEAPTLDAIPNPPAIPQDSGQQTVNLFNITAGPGEAQNLVVTAVSNNTGLIPDPIVTYTSPQTTGSLAYTPVAGQSGSAVITVTVTDDGGTAGGGVNFIVRTFTVTVSPPGANVPPSFIPGPDQNVTDESGPQVVPNWATQISAGPPEESEQVLTVIVTSDNSGLFTEQPQLDLAGTLTFTPAPNVEGTATVTVTLMDDGGTEGGGQDSSTQTFQIHVTKPHRWHNSKPPLGPPNLPQVGRGAMDVDNDGFLTPTDVVLIVNYLNAPRAQFPSFVPPTAPIANGVSLPFLDVDADDFVTPTDVVLIVNVLNAREGGPVGEGTSSGSSPPAGASFTASDLALLLLLRDEEQARPFPFCKNIAAADSIP